MREEATARRYAAALFQRALTTKALDAVVKDMGAVAGALDATPALATFLRHPLVASERKRAILKTAFADTAGADTVGFLNLLVDKRRIDLFAEIKDEFDRLVRAHKNIVPAIAISAVPLTKAQTAALEKSLEARTGKDIELTTQVDPDLLGGVLVRIGDTVLDGTVKGNLERLREQLLAR